MDLSPGMLAEARKKNVYKEFHQMTMGETLGFSSDTFDATISVGVLTVGHAPVHSLDELVRVTRPGGHIVYTLRPDLYEEGGFKEKHAELESTGKWKLAEVGEPTQVLPKGEPDVFHQVWVFDAPHKTQPGQPGWFIVRLWAGPSPRTQKSPLDGRSAA